METMRYVRIMTEQEKLAFGQAMRLVYEQGGSPGFIAKHFTEHHPEFGHFTVERCARLMFPTPIEER